MDYLNSDCSYWYCVHTRSRHEEAVYQRLSDKKIHAFLPKLEVWSKRKDRRKKIQKALFPGYLFVYGPLRGCEGFLIKIKEEKEKLVISLDLLRRSVSVEIESASVEPIT